MIQLIHNDSSVFPNVRQRETDVIKLKDRECPQLKSDEIKHVQGLGAALATPIN